MRSKFLALLPLAAACLVFTACNYDAPLTEKPTRMVDVRLIGDWVAVDKDSQKEELMHVRRLDDSTYVVAFDNDLYRAFHSDFAGRPFLSVQNLQPGGDDRKYVYLTWALSADGGQLTLRTVGNKVIPEQTTPTAGMQKLLKTKLDDPNLLGDPLVFTRKK